jgi:hypothetical protein
MILFVVGLLWLVFEMFQARAVSGRRVVDEPVAYRQRRL